MSAPRKPRVERCNLCRKPLHDGTPTTVVGERPVYRSRPGYRAIDTGHTAPVIWHTACAERHKAEEAVYRQRDEAELAELRAELAEARREIERQRKEES